MAVVVTVDGQFNILVPDGENVAVPESDRALIAAAMLPDDRS